jgi:hypothetical protein
MTTLEPRTNLRPNVSVSLPQFGSTPAPETRVVSGNPTETVRNAVRNVDESVLRPVARRDSGVACQPRTLLALLIYCYARGIYGSVAIERLMHKDTAFRALCRDEFPGASLLRRFRRENRAVVQSCLAEVLRHRAAPLPAEGRPLAQNPEQFAEDASRRLDMAACLDTLEIEG